jgi:hypothetical protein
MDECTNRAAGSLEWKDGGGAREEFEKWKVKQNPHGYTGGHPWWFESGLQKAYDARQPEIDAIKAEVSHWKANHANMVNRSRVLIDRTDLPLERVKAFEQLETLKAENEKLRKAAREVINLTSTIRGKGCGILALEAAVGYLSDAMTAPDTKL